MGAAVLIVITFYQAGLSLASAAVLSDEVKTETTQTLQGEPRPSFGPRRLSRGQGHWCNSRKNVVQALLLIPASPVNLGYNMNSWIGLQLPLTIPPRETDCLEATMSTKLLTTPWPEPHQDGSSQREVMLTQGWVSESLEAASGGKDEHIKYRC